MNHTRQKVVLFGAIVGLYGFVLSIGLPPMKPAEIKEIPEETVRIKLKSLAKPVPAVSAPVPLQKKRADLTPPKQTDPIETTEPPKTVEVSQEITTETASIDEQPVSREPVQTQPAPVELSASEIQSIRSKWLLSVRSSIEKKKKYPKQAMIAEIEGTVVVRFTISKSGAVKAVEIISKRMGVLERATLSAMSTLEAVTPIPESLNNSEITVEIPLVYELK